MSTSKRSAGGFNPGLGQLGVKNPISFTDASDKLIKAINDLEQKELLKEN
jgi:hypothetical protein